MRRNLLLLCIYWFAASMGSYGLIFYTPAFDWNVYLVFVFPTFLNIPMALLVPFLDNKYYLYSHPSDPDYTNVQGRLYATCYIICNIALSRGCGSL